MTLHGSPASSLQNAMDRAIRREYRLAKIISWHRKERKFIRNTEAYKKVVEDNKRFHLPIPHPRSDIEQMLHFHSCSRWRKKPVTLAGPKPEEKLDERTEAEKRMIEAVRQAVSLMSFHMVELSHIPNPSLSYRNHVRQKVLADLIIRLSQSVTPHVPVGFGADVIEEPRTVRLEHTCIDCGGPATTITRSGTWYCEDCAP